MTKVVLVGYMGSGKSVIGKLLSEKTGFLFVDLDDYIEKVENCSINEIFENKGEIYFRKIESLYFKELMLQENNLVLSLGGGTPCYANNIEILLNDNVISIYLNASIETLYSRLILEKSSRPILANKSGEEMKEFIAKHLFERSFYYNKCKHLINVEKKTTQEIIIEIEELLT